MRRLARSWNHRAVSVGLAGLAVVAFLATTTLLAAASPTFYGGPIAGTHLPPPPGAARVVLLGSSPTPSAQLIPGLTLGISANPRAICAFGGSTCPVGVGESRVTMTAIASPNGILAWPNVQVAFVIETTDYDGVYDPGAGDPGLDPCAQSTQILCEESNGVPFFVAHAQSIANAIQAANPHSRVSFALVDYFQANNFDDGDGSEYHVDIPTFIPANAFGPAVTGTFQATELGGGYVVGDSDLSDNQLHSSSITALFGTIIGSGLDWSKNTHHVIVWMGSTCPRDPSCSENYAVSSSDYATFCAPNCMSLTCEPAYAFGGIQSPNCEGWVRSQDGNATHSIAALARTSPTCTDSIGAVCTVDTIDLYNGVTDPWSKAWPTGVNGGGPGGAIVQQDVAKILLAGCNLAAATGGTWDGPNFFACPDGTQGSLQYVPLQSNTNPNTANPTLLAAFRGIGFGPVQTTLVANGTGQPIFQFVPYGNVAIAPNPNFASFCTLQDGVLWQGSGNCDKVPQNLTANGLKFYGWNWSDNASRNQMYVGDVWSVSFNIVSNGPPYTTIPVDSCITFDCKIAGSVPYQGQYTWATYTPVTNRSAVTLSFPVARITVELTPPGPPPIAPPPPPPPFPPPFPIAIPPGIPVISPIGVSAQVGVANIALQATAAGFLAAGFMRVTVKNRPIAMALAAMAGKDIHSKFEGALTNKDAGIGRFE
jgi:hypothetical protein